MQELEQLCGRLNYVRVFNNFINRKPQCDVLYHVQVSEYYSDDEDLLKITTERSLCRNAALDTRNCWEETSRA